MLEGDEKEVDVDKAIAEVRKALEATHIAEQRAMKDGRRVERKPRRVRRLECCACKDKSRASRGGACSSCGHVRCAECLILEAVPTAS